MKPRIALVLFLCAAECLLSIPSTDAFVLLVTPAFQNEFIGDLLNGRDIVFIANSIPTQLLIIQFDSGLIKFDTRYTYVSMDWFRQSPLTQIDYEMTVTSSNTSIMAQPTVTGIPLVGSVEPIFPALTTFNTSLDCLAAGTTVLEVVMVYNVTNYAPAMGSGSNGTMTGTTNGTMNGTDPEADSTQYDVVSMQNYTATLRVRKECAAPPQPTSPPATVQVTVTVTVPAQESSLSNGAIAGIVVGILIAVACVVLLLLVLMRREKKLQQRNRRMTQDLVRMNELVDGEKLHRTTTGYSGYSSNTSNLPPMAEDEMEKLMERLREEHQDLEEFLLPKDDIELGKEIGRGAFGRVYDGNVIAKGQDGYERPRLHVAIKTVKSAVRPADVEEFLNEASLMKGFRHPNVVALIGICMEGNEPPKVCLEYMGLGDLRGYLRKSRGIGENGELTEMTDDEHPFQVQVQQLLIFCLHIAQGMAYLEKKKFVHRDLATRNCMLNDELIVKIGDFGLARDIHEDNYYRMGTARRLPVKWMSLESLQDQIYTTMSDVWSFGVVVWEVFSLGQSPYPGLVNDELPTFLLSGKRLGRPELCPEDLYAMYSTCWSREPKDRPTFLELTKMLVEYKDNFYTNVQLKEPDGPQQEYQNVNPKGAVGGVGQHDRAMSLSGGYSHAGSVATGVTYIQDSDGRLYMYSQSSQYSGGHPQYSADSQYTGGSADFINPGYHLVNTNMIPEGYVCVPPNTAQQMVVLQNPLAQSGEDQAEPYRNVQVHLTPMPQMTHAPVSPTSVTTSTSIPPPPPTLESGMHEQGQHINERDEYVAHV